MTIRESFVARGRDRAGRGGTKRCAAAMLVAVAVGVAPFPACSGSGPDGPSPVIRVGYAGEADFGDLPSLAAHTRLRAQGVPIEVDYYSSPDLAIEAAARGSADIVHGSMIGAWAAASRGARIRTVATHVVNPYRFVTATGVTRCADLDGRRLGLAAEGAVSTFLVRAFLAEACPAARPVQAMMMESTSRSAALMTGGLDGTVLELSALLWVERQAPGRFQVLSDFSTRWPLVPTEGVHVNAVFAAAHPDLVRNYLRALVAATRDLGADSVRLVAEATAQLGPSDEWTIVAPAYLDGGVWPEDGGLTPTVVSDALTFFARYGAIAPGTMPDDVSDLRFLRDTLTPK